MSGYKLKDIECGMPGCLGWKTKITDRFCPIHTGVKADFVKAFKTAESEDRARAEKKAEEENGPCAADLIMYKGRAFEVLRRWGKEIHITRFDVDHTSIILNENPNFRQATGDEEYKYLKEKELYEASFRPGMEPVETESFEGTLGLILSDLEVLLTKKNKDYGSSYDDTVEELGETVILVRIKDKYNRLKQLIKSGEEPEVEETIEETLSDLVGYGIIELVRRRRNP